MRVMIAWFDGPKMAMLDSRPWAISSVGERFPHTEEATGSIPVSPTIVSYHLSGPIATLHWTKTRTGDRLNPVAESQREVKNA